MSIPADAAFRRYVVTEQLLSILDVAEAELEVPEEESYRCRTEHIIASMSQEKIDMLYEKLRSLE